MRFVTYILTALLAAILVLIPVALRFPDVTDRYALAQILRAGAAVDKGVDDMAQRLETQLKGLGEAIEFERDFAMKLLVERDSMAAAITEIAGQYMKPMGFSALDIIASSGTVLSSGHFPARAGNLAAAKAAQLDSGAMFVYENFRGRQVLTFQAKRSITASGAKLAAIGGFAVDSAFLQQLRPHGGVRILLRIGAEIIGRSDIETISPITNNTIIINDSTFNAASATLPAAGIDERAEIIVYSEPPKDLTLLDLF